jgi:hypothetical protein
MKFERIEQEGANSLDKIEFVMVACAAQALINGVMGPNLKDLRAAEGAGVSALGPLPATLGNYILDYSERGLRWEMVDTLLQNRLVLEHDVKLPPQSSLLVGR